MTDQQKLLMAIHDANQPVFQADGTQKPASIASNVKSKYLGKPTSHRKRQKRRETAYDSLLQRNVAKGLVKALIDPEGDTPPCLILTKEGKEVIKPIIKQQKDNAKTHAAQQSELYNQQNDVTELYETFKDWDE